MSKIFNKINNSKYRFVIYSIFFTCLIVLGIYLLKGIYPFGKETIICGDMGQSYVTFYHQLYDVLHGSKSIFYSFTLGMGSNVYGGEVVDGLFNPLTWLVYFVSRNNISYFFSLLLIVKLITISITSSICIDKFFKKVNFKWKLIFNLMYVFSYYIMLNYTNIMWLDIVALFPLLLLGIKNICERKSPILFIITLSLSLIFNYNLAYMLLFFLLFCTPFIIKYFCKNENKKVAVSYLFFGTLFSIVLSAFAFIPAFHQTMTSYRMNSNQISYVFNTFGIKTLNLFLYCLPLYFYFHLLKYIKKDKIVKCSFIIITMTFILPLFFENINLMWHTGSYNCFPYRYGFIPFYILILSALYYIDKYLKIKPIKINNLNKIVMTICFVIIVILEFRLFTFINYNDPVFYLSLKSTLLIIIIMIISNIIITNLVKSNNIKTLFIFHLFLYLIFSFNYIGVEKKYNKEVEHNDNTFITVNKINKKLNLNNNIFRIKDTTASMIENYPLALDIPSNSTFLHIISSDQVNNYRQLGYSVFNTKLNDIGGTLLSNSIYGVKYYISNEELDSSIYKKIGKVDNLYLYENLYSNNFSFLTGKINSSIPKNLNVFEANNYLYKQVTNSSKNQLVKTNPEIIKKNDSHTSYIVNFDSKNELYFYSSINRIKKIVVNGKIVNIPTVGNKNNKNYPIKTRGGIIDLGVFDSKVTIDVYYNDKNKYNNDSDNYIYSLDLNEYKNFIPTKNDYKIKLKHNKIYIDINVDSDKRKLFLPFNYDIGWNINSDYKIEKVLNNFIGINLHKGHNKIILTFVPYLFNTCLIVSIIGVISLITFVYIRKKFKLKEIKAITYPIYYLMIIVIIVLFLKVYLLSILK